MSNKYAEYQKYKNTKSLKHFDLVPTPSDIEGPFYLDGAPFREVIHPASTKPKDVLHVHGKVMNVSGNFVSPYGGQVVLDFWQADELGVYDEKGYNFRGKVVAKFDGHSNTYDLFTVRPGDYDISDPGSPLPHDFRCSHIHVKVTCDGYKPLTTQLYFKTDPYNATDHWFSNKRIIADDGTFDFVLEQVVVVTMPLHVK
jgi:protocatechuate 3,4-dioxygenase beta subunit